MYINNCFKYVVIEKAANIAYQALWIEVDIQKIEISYAQLYTGNIILLRRFKNVLNKN